MPSSIMSSLPEALKQGQTALFNLERLTAVSRLFQGAMQFGWNALNAQVTAGLDAYSAMARLWGGFGLPRQNDMVELFQKEAEVWRPFIRDHLNVPFAYFQRELDARAQFLKFFVDEPREQDWSFPEESRHVMLDLPGMRLIDVSSDGDHRLRNYTVVFAPRAGHHSNVAEKTALYLRKQGLSRIAVVEQKCTDDIPLHINGQRHYENFDSQVNQYRQILTCLKEKTGVPSHLVAVCQPGPLLMATLILNPELGRTFGSAGSPMHTEAQRGFLTDFSRAVGKGYIDTLLTLFPKTIDKKKVGAGRRAYDGRLHILGFYWLGLNQHLTNFKTLWDALHKGDTQTAERQIAFYQWYNTVIHLPEGFIKDTYKKIFVGNELIRGCLKIGGRAIGIQDYPQDVPIWALGGSRDHIAPTQQAIGHIALLENMPEDCRLPLVCEAGHMGLFRSQTILERHYPEIAAFMLRHSDTV